jgi:hypothetical protein
MDEHIIRFEIFISDTKIASASCTVRSKKKIEMALINTLQLAARKNLILFFHTNRPGRIPELLQVITDNCNLIDVPTLRRSFENMKQSVALCLEAEGRHFAHLL